MNLGKRQRIFTQRLAQLVLWAYDQGYEFSQGDGYRDPRAFGVVGESGPYGSKFSQHKVRLAHDLNLFIDGEYISDGNHPAWAKIGAKWESITKDINGRWGGRYNDANHLECTEHDWRA